MNPCYPCVPSVLYVILNNSRTFAAYSTFILFSFPKNQNEAAPYSPVRAIAYSSKHALHLLIVRLPLHDRARLHHVLNNYRSESLQNISWSYESRLICPSKIVLHPLLLSLLHKQVKFSKRFSLNEMMQVIWKVTFKTGRFNTIQDMLPNQKCCFLPVPSYVTASKTSLVLFAIREQKSYCLIPLHACQTFFRPEVFNNNCCHNSWAFPLLHGSVCVFCMHANISKAEASNLSRKPRSQGPTLKGLADEAWACRNPSHNAHLTSIWEVASTVAYCISGALSEISLNILPL